MGKNTLRYTNIAMEFPPFEDVFPIENGDIPARYVSLPEGKPLLAGRAIVCIVGAFQQQKTQAHHFYSLG